MALRSHCSPKMASSAPTTSRSAVSGSSVMVGPSTATTAASTSSAAAIPWKVDRHSRVRPEASTMVSASVASTAQATKTVSTRGSAAVIGSPSARGLRHTGDNGGVTDTTADEPEGTGWLVLIYRVPPEPTRLRSTVWRRIKSLGAIYLQNSAAALPASAATERALRKLRREILDMSGTAILLSCDVLAGEADVRSAFQAARNDEYEEIVDRCEDFLQQVQKEYTANHFTYAELEENEVDLVKLRNWFAKVRERDAFGAEGRQPAEKALDTCEQSLEAYAARVYAEEAESR